ncbi:type II toxin-antitoxin system HicB family antitoxin [Secundilactobacillus malefermentans]|uniref:type II toxin-antitoxin system HicB family antitoxin n=1 Tax=Secundilactobacillus malefermentans TaxID=176292 RepID=UPI0011C86D5D|nr:type II toxin-antitoxin system HicB family antitoxin [Secundilactobacillus malefermentans]QEA31405.1 type II toxin-antitoxin system HicB family antitoxin [Secundilactobacillus malefermentans]
MSDLILTYSVLIKEDSKDSKVPYLVYIPAFDGYTQGTSIADAIGMARDFIGLQAIDYLNEHRELPAEDIHGFDSPDGINTIVDINVDQYRRRHDTKVVKKTLTIPNYLNELGMEQKLNFSKVLTEALKQKLNI